MLKRALFLLSALGCSFALKAEWLLSMSTGTFHPITRFTTTSSIFFKAAKPDVLEVTQLTNRLQLTWEKGSFFVGGSAFNAVYSTQWRYCLPGEELGESYLQMNQNRSIQAALYSGYRIKLKSLDAYISVGISTYLPFYFDHTEAYKKQYSNRTGNWSSNYQITHEQAMIGTLGVGARKQFSKSNVFVFADLSAGYGLKTLLKQSEMLITPTKSYRLEAISKGDFMMLHWGIGIRLAKPEAKKGCFWGW